MLSWLPILETFGIIWHKFRFWTMDDLHYRLNFDLNKSGQNFITD